MKRSDIFRDFIVELKQANAEPRMKQRCARPRGSQAANTASAAEQHKIGHGPNLWAAVCT